MQCAKDVATNIRKQAEQVVAKPQTSSAKSFLPELFERPISVRNASMTTTSMPSLVIENRQLFSISRSLLRELNVVPYLISFTKKKKKMVNVLYNSIAVIDDGEVLPKDPYIFR